MADEDDDAVEPADAEPPRPPTPLPPLKPRKRRWRAGPVMVVVLVNLLGLGAYGRVRLDQNRALAKVRHCFANQKTFTGALEMFKLDRDLKSPKLVWNADLVATLVSGGYLRSVIPDIDGGTGSWKYYQVDPKGSDRVLCLHHGAFWEQDERASRAYHEEPRKKVPTPPRGAQPYTEVPTHRPKMADEIHEDARRLGEP